MLLRNTLFAAALSALAVAGIHAPAAQAHDMATVGDITVEGAWTRATAPSAPNGGAFMTIHNKGTQPDRLVAASTPAAARTELHTHTMVDGVMKMRPVEGGIPVPASGDAILKPGGLHVMMMGLKAPLAMGKSVPVTLTFEHAGSVTIDVPIMKAGARMPSMDQMGGQMDGHGDMKKHGDMDMPHDPAPHGAPVVPPGGNVVRP